MNSMYLLQENQELKAELQEANERLADIDDSMKFIMDEACSLNERHCGCVPTLKIRVKELVGLYRALRNNLDNPAAVAALDVKFSDFVAYER